MNKYRHGKIKREHTVIEKVWPVLEKIAECEAVTTIIPGPISRLRSRGLEFTFQRFTETGLRLLAKNGSAVQEVYLVAPQKESVLSWLAAQAIIDWKPEPPPKPVLESPGDPRKTVELPSDMTCEACGRLMMAGARVVRLGKRPYNYVHVRCAK